jgi:hypothetical protein
LMATEVVNEAEPSKESAMWRNHAGAKVPPAAREKLLENVAKQTGLTFVKENRMTTRWFLVPAGK